LESAGHRLYITVIIDHYYCRNFMISIFYIVIKITKTIVYIKQNKLFLGRFNGFHNKKIDHILKIQLYYLNYCNK
jgi:hypothetical protein